MYIDIILLAGLVLAGLWTVMTRSILRAAMGLALTSVILAIIMFKLNAALAAVFELSVCAGLISVLFVSTISLTQPYTNQEVLQRMKDMAIRFRYLPVVIMILGIGLILIKVKPTISLPAPEVMGDTRAVMWYFRRIDILGQVIILLVGVFGVLILLKEKIKK